MYKENENTSSMLNKPIYDKTYLDDDIFKYSPNYELRNFIKNGKFDNKKYNFNFNELELNLTNLAEKVNANQETIQTEIVNIIKENIDLIRKMSYLIKKNEFIKKYRFKE